MYFFFCRKKSSRLVEDECLAVQKREQKAVQMVSDVAESCRKVHEQNSGKKIELVLPRHLVVCRPGTLLLCTAGMLR